MSSSSQKMDELFEDAESTVDGFDETMTVSEYVDEVYDDPQVIRGAPERVWDAMRHYGSEFNDEEGRMEYAFVTEDPLNDGKKVMYGDATYDAIDEFANKLENAAKNLASHKRLLLLLGPVGSGKTEFSKKLTEAYEEYTKTDEGRMYTWDWTNLYELEEDGEIYRPIKDQDPRDDRVAAPMFQDPLLLLPEQQREQLLEEVNEEFDGPYTLDLDQSLTPESQFYMDELTKFYLNERDAEDELDARQQVFENHVDIKRHIADENRKQSVSTFEPKDKKNQDEAELTGGIDLSKIGTYGERDPRAFDYGGALPTANRGIFSGEELLKLETELLYTFLEATENSTIDPKNNPLIDIDEVIIGRTNMAEFLDKKSDEKMKAFNSRTNKIDFPYLTEYEDEAKIYEKFLNNSDWSDEINVEPHTLDMAALFAVATRLEEPQSEVGDVIEKALAYNGDRDDVDLEKLMREADRDSEEKEGMDGVTTRYIEDELADAIVDNKHRGKDFVNAPNVLKYLRDNLDQNGSIPRERHDEYRTLIDKVEGVYKERAIQDVRHALAYDKEELQKQGDKYFDHVMADVENRTVKDEFDRPTEPDESFMRSIEKHVNISDDKKEEFRNAIANWIAGRSREGESFEPLENDRIREALERKSWQDKKNSINFTALISDDKKLDEEQRSSTIEALLDEGYSAQGAEELLQYVGAEVAKEEFEGEA